MKRLILASLLISSLAFGQSFSGGLPIQVGNPSVGTINSPSPSSGTLIGIKDLSGNMIPITESASGITVNASFNPSSILNTNRNWTLNSATDSVSAVQSGIWNIGTVSNVSGTIAASQNGTWNINNVSGTVSLPTGAATAVNQTNNGVTLSSINGKLPAALGQTSMANSLAVVVASNQSAIPVSGSVSGSVQSLPISVTASSVSRVANSASSQNLVALNVNRHGLYLYNDSTANCYVKFGATASLTSFAVKLFSTDTYIMDPPIYTGTVDYICDAASGSMEVNEL